jgi:N-acyl-D-aspartate/D-glutamate deacylase
MPEEQRCDILLRGGTVFDGLGNPGFCADVAITGERVVAIGELEGWRAGVEVSVQGLCVAPGFIDIHTHADFSLNHHPEQLSVLFQGVTTQVGGNCGFAVGQIDDTPLFRQEQRWLKPYGVSINWRSFDEYLRMLDELGLGTNYVPQCGHGTARKKVMGYEKRPPTPAELDAMRREIAQCFEAGAVAFTTGLEYPPNSFAETEEIIELAKVAAQYGGFYATHLRSEGDYLIESVQEALRIAQEAGLPLQLAHHKAEGRHNWGKVQQTLQLVSEAVAQGLDVTLDVYPYTAYQTSLAVASLPSWALDGDPDALLARLRDPHERERLIHAMREAQPDWHSTVIGSTPHNREYQGLTLADAARLAGKDPEPFVLDSAAGRGRACGRGVVQHGGGRPAHCAAVPADDGRLRRRGHRTQQVRRRATAPAQLRHFPARAGKVCAAGGAAEPGGGDFQDDGAARRAPETDRPRRAAGRRIRRHRGVRLRRNPRLGGLPEPAPLGARGRASAGERAVRHPRRGVHGNPRGARLATGVAYFPVGRSRRNMASGVARTYHDSPMRPM